jgi:hypothetical protein
MKASAPGHIIRTTLSRRDSSHFGPCNRPRRDRATQWVLEDCHSECLSRTCLELDKTPRQSRQLRPALWLKEGHDTCQKPASTGGQPGEKTREPLIPPVQVGVPHPGESETTDAFAGQEPCLS